MNLKAKKMAQEWSKPVGRSPKYQIELFKLSQVEARGKSAASRMQG